MLILDVIIYDLMSFIKPEIKEATFDWRINHNLASDWSQQYVLVSDWLILVDVYLGCAYLRSDELDQAGDQGGDF